MVYAVSMHKQFQISSFDLEEVVYCSACRSNRHRVETLVRSLANSVCDSQIQVEALTHYHQVYNHRHHSCSTPPPFLSPSSYFNPNSLPPLSLLLFQPKLSPSLLLSPSSLLFQPKLSPSLSLSPSSYFNPNSLPPLSLLLFQPKLSPSSLSSLVQY